MRKNPSVDRRAVLLGGCGAIASLAGCVSTSRTPPSAGGGAQNSEGNGPSVSQLKVGGSSTVYPITKDAAAVWSSNPEAGDPDYWEPGEYGIDTDERLANYWAGLYGFDSDGATPPFNVNVGLSHSGTGLEKCKNGLVDIGNASAPVAAEFPDMSEAELDEFENHVVGVDAQPIVVSQDVYDAGVTRLTAEQVRGIYRGEIENWSEIPAYDGPDREIQAVGRAEGSGTDTAFRTNMLGDPNAAMGGVDVRKGQNQQVKTIVGESTNAVAYMALAFVGESTPTVALEFEDTVYERGENLADENYPLSRDLHCYTYDGTSEKEAAFLRMVISEFGQRNYVEPAGYAMLTEERRQTELDKLPETR